MGKLWVDYSNNSRKCTHSSFCRRPSRLVASLICYLLSHAYVHEISALMTWFQYMLDISSYYGYHDPCISSSWRFLSMYIVCGDDHLCDILYHAYSWSGICIHHIAPFSFTRILTKPLHNPSVVVVTTPLPGLTCWCPTPCAAFLTCISHSLRGLSDIL